MKKVFWIILILLVIFIIIGSSGNSNSTESTDIWKIYAELDEFKNETGNHYVKNEKSFKGTFSDSSTTDDDAYLYILISNDEVAIVIREYEDDDDWESKAYYDEEYEITVLDESGTKHTLSGVKKEDESKIVLEDNTIIELLKNNNKVKIHGKMIEHPTNTFLFTVEKDNFTEVYNECVGNDN